MDLVDQAVPATLQYLRRYLEHNDDAVEAANRNIFEDLVLELNEKVHQHSERLKDHGEKLRDLNEKQQRSILYEFIEAARKTSSPAKQRAYRNLAARFWLPGEDIDVLPFWWNRLVDIDPGLWAAILHLDGRGLKLVDGKTEVAELDRGFRHRVRQARKQLVHAEDQPRYDDAVSLLPEGLAFEDAPESKRFVWVCNTHSAPFEERKTDQPKYVNSAKVFVSHAYGRGHLFWLAGAARELLLLTRD